MLAHQVLEHLLGHVRLKDPHRALRPVDGGRALTLVAILGLTLPAPARRGIVVLPDVLSSATTGEPFLNTDKKAFILPSEFVIEP